MEDISILIIEDDEDINNLLKEILQEAEPGYKIRQGFSGTEGKLLYSMERPDLVLVDLMMPGLTGEEIVGKIRQDSTLPIVVVSAKLDTDTKVRLLELGADDFIVKPFDPEELVARVRAQLRRYRDFSNKGGDQDILDFKNLVLNRQERRVEVRGQEIRLTAKEYEILSLLLSYPKKVFTKSNLYQSIWGDSAFIDDNTLNVHISNLRNKISQFDSQEEYIETVWGIGFKLKN